MNIEQQLQHKIDFKTKPLGALGFLEDIAFKIGRIQNTLTPQLTHPSLLVFAADHGLAQDGVSAYPPEVTYQMVMNFLQGGAAINVFCKQHNFDLKIIDSGVNHDFEDHPHLLKAKAGYGTKSALREAAMTIEQLNYCLTASKKTVQELAAKGSNIIGFGEMGIGNTSSASLLMSSLLQLPIEDCVGRGTGMNNDQLQHKLNILKQVIAKHPKPNNVQEALLYFGGFEIAQMCGAMLEAFEQNMVILVDGFIASSAFLAAYTMQPNIINNAIFCHQSDEKGHQLMLESLQQRAILGLNLRLGEGTGCVLAYPIVQSAVAFLNEMASFESANVSNK
jgi:nicotinate-nucleotide--dimethylbenzimidazole phosphoribosyltransferase